MENNQLQKKILAEMVCPVCVEYLSPPIRQCIMGHVLCSSCFERCNNCPICRAPKSTSRCFALERIYSKMTFPCKNELDGCNYSNKGPIVKQHEKSCPYNIRECPLNIKDYCKWRGPASELFNHCNNVHKHEVIASNHQMFIWDDFEQIEDLFFCELLQAYGQLFRFSWRVDGDTRAVKFCVHHLGENEDAKRFAYEISFKAKHIKTFRFNSRCEPYCENGSIFENGSFLRTDFDTIRVFLDKEGALTCILKIIELL